MTVKVIIATPLDGAYTTATVHAGYAWALSQVLKAYPAEMFPSNVMFAQDVCRARNRAAAMILREATDATHVLWWDSDVFPHDISIIKYMIETGEDVIGAPYRRKQGECAWTHMGFMQPRNEHVHHVEAVGFGFTLTSVSCLRRMSERYASELEYRDARPDGTRHPAVGIFNLVWSRDNPETRELLSEDWSFCKRWRAMGGDVALYTGPGSVLSHVGSVAFTNPAK